MAFGEGGSSSRAHALVTNNYITIIGVILALTHSPLWSSPPLSSPHDASPSSPPDVVVTEVDDPFSPWTKDGFGSSIRDSSTQVGDADPPDDQWKTNLVSALEREYGADAPFQPSISTSAHFDNTGVSICHAV